jgi:vacuolar protein sorting-associated protein 11
VCHKNNLRLCETLRAQSEARGQHEQFHNILNRSPEPFSVVSEHFGRGLFNKIMIIDDDLTGDDQVYFYIFNYVQN